MQFRFGKNFKGLLTLIAFLPTVATALNTTVTLTADATITPTNSEVITFGLPLAQGDVTSTNQIRVLMGGVEQSIYVETGLTWHFGDKSLRTVTIQMQGVNMTGGNITLTITDAGRNTANDRLEVSHSNGWATGQANKAKMPFPRIFAKHDLTYLASTGIIPPYIPGTAGEGVGKLQSDQFNNSYGALDFSINGANAQSSFLFDRATAMMKAYMTTGEVKFLKEGFMTKQLYFAHVKNTGTAPTPAGGDGCWTFGNTACADGKYIYTQPAKLALALFGDNSQWDNSLIIEMATQADLGWNQPATRDLHDAENEGFTERAAGITGLAEIGAYEITGDATILAHLNERIDSLKDMQQTVRPWETGNFWAKSGAFIHSWANHEGDAYPGNGKADDRRFSPWMSENIADFLWQTYKVTGRKDIPEMLRQLGNAIDLYGFTSSYGTGLGLSASYTKKPGLVTIDMSCSAPDNVPVSQLYSASNVASAAAIAATAANDGGGADQHNVELVLPLALAFYFETDANARTRLYSRIKHIERQWLNNSPGSNQNCSLIFSSQVYRLFNWQHRSNSFRTFNWAVSEIGGVFVGSSSSDSTILVGNLTDQVIKAGQVVTNQGTLINPINSGTVNGGNLSGNVSNSGTGVLNNVNLNSGTTVTGGSMTGSVTGEGTIKNSLINVATLVSTITIGSGSKVSTTTAKNVSGLNLTGAVVDGSGKLLLTQALLVEPDGKELSILQINKAAIDKLFGNLSTTFQNDTKSNLLQIMNPGIAGLVIPVTPVAVVTTTEPDSVSVINSSGELLIVSKGIKTTFTPAASDLAAFQSGINTHGGNTNLLANGLVFIDISGGKFSVRFSLVASAQQASGTSASGSGAAASSSAAGFKESGSLLKPATYRVTVHYPNGSKQELLPSLHNLDSFQSLLGGTGMQAVISGVDGSIEIRDAANKTTWRGIASYIVSPLSGGMRVSNTNDLNGDGISDLFFDSGIYRQAIYGLPLN